MPDRVVVAVPDRASVLIADGDEAFLLTTGAMLEGQGFACRCVSDPADVASTMLQDAYDVAIISMGVLEQLGSGVAGELATRFEAMPVLLVADSPDDRIAADAVRLSVAATMAKPVGPTELCEAVRLAIGRRPARCAAAPGHDRPTDWHRQLAETVSNSVVGTPGDLAPLPVGAFVALTPRNITAALLDMQHLTEAMSGRSEVQHACGLFACPRLAACRDALQHTVTVLESTKSSFKSKELAGLRQRLERVVADLDGQGTWTPCEPPGTPGDAAGHNGG